MDCGAGVGRESCCAPRPHRSPPDPGRLRDARATAHESARCEPVGLHSGAGRCADRARWRAGPPPGHRRAYRRRSGESGAPAHVAGCTSPTHPPSSMMKNERNDCSVALSTTADERTALSATAGSGRSPNACERPRANALQGMWIRRQKEARSCAPDDRIGGCLRQPACHMTSPSPGVRVLTRGVRGVRIPTGVPRIREVWPGTGSRRRRRTCWR